MPTSRYEGDELTLFAEARNWKEYYARLLRPYICGDVLEVGAGIGGTTRVLNSGNQRSWTCIEPDRELVRELQTVLAALAGPVVYEARPGTIEDLDDAATFDTILYIDVLEHIRDDAAELERAVRRLRPGGHLIVLAPAHDWLFSEFDRQIGHHRRYNAKSLVAIQPAGTKPEKLFYLDSCGTLLSLANRLLLRESCPTRKQIALWDRIVVPTSRVLDRLVRYRLGKTVVAIWRRP